MKYLNPCVLSVSLLVSLPCSYAVAAVQGSTAETVTDYDGNVYQTVKIGNQVWMTENLRTTHYSDGTPIESFAMDNDEANAETYGRLYRWESALRGYSAAEGDPREIQGASPAGWHIPSEAEWLELINHLGGEAVAGGHLKEAGSAHWSEPNTGAGNETGFGALPTGWFDFSGDFKGLGEKSFLRSSTSPGGGGGYAWELNRTSASCLRVFLHPDDAIPIRCIKNR